MASLEVCSANPRAREGLSHPEHAVRFLAAVVESSDDAIITKDLDGVITSWNQGAERLFGYSSEEAIGQPVSMLIPADRKGEENEILAQLRRGERIDHYETVRQSKDGTLLNISITVSPVRNTEGKIIGASKLARDITAQRAAREAARFFAAVIEFSDDAIITKDLNGIITSWNNSAEHLFGYASEEAVGQPVSMLIPSDRKNEESDILARLRRGERIEHYETVRQRKDGTQLDISITVSPVRNADGKIIGASKIARNITDRKRAELELRDVKDQLARTNDVLEKRVAERTASLQQAIAQMEEFSYSVSHDLRGPVRAMKGYAQVALEDYGNVLDSKGRDILDRIVRGSSRMERLIHDILTYTRLARADNQVQPVSVDKLVPELIQQYSEMQPPHADISIRQPLHSVLAHEPSLAQAISNLLANGVKFVARGTTPRLQIWTEPRNGAVRLWIEDNGIGIKPEYQHRLFGMFERVHQDKSYDGTGIGLAIVRKAVERSGGRVGVESDGITGCSFWIELPPAGT